MGLQCYPQDIRAPPPYMCPIHASEEFITEFGELPVLSLNSVHALSPLAVNHVFVLDFGAPIILH